METPITGVVNCATPLWLHDETYNAIDVAAEEISQALAALEEDRENKEALAVLRYYGFNTAQSIEDLRDEFEYMDFPVSDLLVGDWEKHGNGEWTPTAGKAGYSAISGEAHTQVVKSLWVQPSAPCSPCYPGQGDLENDGSRIAHTLPPSVWGDDIDPLHVERIRSATARWYCEQLADLNTQLLNKNIGFSQFRQEARRIRRNYLRAMADFD